MNELIVGDRRFRVISQRHAYGIEEGQGFRWENVENPRIKPSHRLALRAKIADALNHEPTFAAFGGVIQIRLDRYQVAPVEEVR